MPIDPDNAKRFHACETKRGLADALSMIENESFLLITTLILIQTSVAFAFHHCNTLKSMTSYTSRY
ncbi:hypothetical protein BU24DRAFT_418951 [Aaosphaeria arxii CBS 175.79]|uniref:Uncharacterized protein n=1 Tax=Aaosphaeria arxii CBS 175.79 TaxID=1450172 RepID=A0A6A5Y296_9PLEO|nr:uncharacterized protein BU24DRAFT_418951 [Aaosphaeria arxii CBS 175.79]KAF2019343.1 hypothetical protein BU24DRAFT_418951 [Aaosphaeria arxii CBS 175.79]